MKIFRLAIAGFVLPVALAAQQPTAAQLANPITSAFRARILSAHRNIAQAFDSIPASKFDYKPTPFTTAAENVAAFEAKAKAARDVLAGASDTTYMEPWTMRNGETVYMTMPKIAVIRSFVFNHMIHHRAQLSVYLRLLDVKFPGMYGPTADEPM